MCGAENEVTFRKPAWFSNVIKKFTCVNCGSETVCIFKRKALVKGGMEVTRVLRTKTEALQKIMEEKKLENIKLQAEGQKGLSGSPSPAPEPLPEPTA